MKRIYTTILIMLLAAVGMTALAQDRPDIVRQTSGGDRGGFVFYDDQPSVDYNSETKMITVQGNACDFYLLVVTTAATQVEVFETVIDGVMDTIDAHDFLTGTYTFKFTSSRGNVYTWMFNNGFYGRIVPNFQFDNFGGQTIPSGGLGRIFLEY